MSINRRLQKRVQRRECRVRNRLKKSGLPRISVFRSSKNMSVQVIDDLKHETLVSMSTLTLDFEKDSKKVDQAHALGVALGKKITEQGLGALCFDRGRHLYHGRVKALAEGLRESGVSI